MIEETSKMQWQKVKNQFLATVVVNLATMGFGAFEGWSSPSIVQLTSDKSPLPSGEISMEEASWVASMHCIGGLFGNIIFGYIINKFGRRLPLILITFPLIISWTLACFAQNLYYLLAARLVGGFFGGGGAYVIVPLFIAEISDDRIRGFLTSTYVLNESFGNLIAFIVAEFFGFTGIPIFGILLAILCGILTFFIPETPLFLVKQNKIDKAEKSIRFYQNIRANDTRHDADDRKLIVLEIDRLKGIINDLHTKSTENSFDWSELKTAITQKALLIGLVLMVLYQFSGVVAMMSYTASIFQDTASFSPNVASIITSVIQLLGNCFATNLVDRLGRKILIVSSAVGVALGQVVLGVYVMLKSWNIDVTAFNWIPVTAFSFVLFVSMLGILSLPFLLLAEIMPEKIKDGSVSFCMGLSWIFSFITIKYLPALNKAIGLHGSMYLFASVCIFGAVFIIFRMPETKCKNHEEIMKSLE